MESSDSRRNVRDVQNLPYFFPNLQLQDPNTYDNSGVLIQRGKSTSRPDSNGPRGPTYMNLGSGDEHDPIAMADGKKRQGMQQNDLIASETSDSSRKRNNSIVEIADQNGRVASSTEEILVIASDYFSDLFTASLMGATAVIFDNVRNNITSDFNNVLLAPFMGEEVHAALRTISNVSDSLANDISTVMGVRVSINPEKYLGLPTMVGRRKRDAFSHYFDRFNKLVDNWNIRNLSKGDK
ncbi:hypothetical protein V6N13_065814 [Hibiscus sabdariffa]